MRRGLSVAGVCKGLGAGRAVVGGRARTVALREATANAVRRSCRPGLLSCYCMYCSMILITLRAGEGCASAADTSPKHAKRTHTVASISSCAMALPRRQPVAASPLPGTLGPIAA